MYWYNYQFVKESLLVKLNYLFWIIDKTFWKYNIILGNIYISKLIWIDYLKFNKIMKINNHHYILEKIIKMIWYEILNDCNFKNLNESSLPMIILLFYSSFTIRFLSYQMFFINKGFNKKLDLKLVFNS